MFLYITEIIFFLSVATIAYLIIRKLPHVEHIRAQEVVEEEARSLAHKSADVVKKLDQQSLFYIGRMLRKVRVWVLRLDNRLAKNLEAVKKKSEEQEETQHVLKNIPSSSEPQSGEEEKK
jgi:predicted NBD/HSP70 family sugar kinase